jgi:hypothetical protein
MRHWRRNVGEGNALIMKSANMSFVGTCIDIMRSYVLINRTSFKNLNLTSMCLERGDEASDVICTIAAWIVHMPCHGLRRNAPNFLQKRVATEEFLHITRGRNKLHFYRGQQYTILLGAIPMDEEATEAARWKQASESYKHVAVVPRELHQHATIP